MALKDAGNIMSQTTRKYSGKFTVNGSVTRIWASNFLTFSKFEMRPEPNLNLIIGPNGTGKSSLVNALVLGLAGKPSVLGRASRIVDYIQYGKEKADIEIELFNEDGTNWVVHREILKNGHSNWSINGKSTTLKSVEDLMTKLNIQVHNLCQFLPQDKVADFAKMTPIELLHNTQKAAGSEELFQMHEELMNSRSETQKLETDLNSGQKNLEQEQVQQNRLEELVRNNKAREKHLNNVKILEQKHAWMQYLHARDNFLEERNKHNEREKELKEMKKKFAPQERKVIEAKQRLEVAKLKHSKVSPPENMVNRVERLKAQLEEQTEKVASAKSELEFLKNEESRRLENIRCLEKQINLQEEEYSKACQVDYTELKERMLQLNEEVKALGNKVLMSEHKVSEADEQRSRTARSLKDLERQLKQLNDVVLERERNLSMYNSDVCQALDWMRNNKNLFKNNVYEPILLNISMVNPAYAKYVETHIPQRDMLAFVFEDKADRELFMSEVRDRRGLRVNTVEVPRETLDQFQPTHDLGNFRKFGFQFYLKDSFQAPDGIMRYLCKQYGVHSVPVGNEVTEKNVSSVIQGTPFRLFYTSVSRVSVRSSRYNRSNVSTLSSEIRPAKLLGRSVDQSVIDDLNRQYRDTEVKLHAETEVFNRLRADQFETQKAREELLTQLKKLKVDVGYVNNLKTRIEVNKKKLEERMNSKVNIKEEEQKTQAKIKELVMHKDVFFKTFADSSRKTFAQAHKRVLLSAACVHAFGSVQAAEKDIESQKEAVKEFEDEVKALEEKVKHLKQEARALLLSAKKVTNLQRDEELPAEKKKLFSQFPDDVEDIEARIYDERSRAELLGAVDPAVLHEYDARRKNISRLEHDISKKTERLEQLRTEIDRCKQEWLPAVENLIHRINVNFSKFFSRIKCVGEIALDKTNNAEDYHKWGLVIRVKFRDNEPLQELTAMHHSGGEQSVSTALYMLALQELTHVPFRCIDEINQGMDSKNERVVFEFLSETACMKNNAQYFLLTPKLLPKLKYSEKMKVFIINNGPFFCTAKNWNIKTFLDIAKDL